MRLKIKKVGDDGAVNTVPDRVHRKNEPGESSLLQSTTTRIIRDARLECEGIVRAESFVELSARFDEIMPFRCKAILPWVDTGCKEFYCCIQELEFYWLGTYVKIYAQIRNWHLICMSKP